MVRTPGVPRTSSPISSPWAALLSSQWLPCCSLAMPAMLLRPCPCTGCSPCRTFLPPNTYKADSTPSLTLSVRPTLTTLFKWSQLWNSRASLNLLYHFIQWHLDTFKNSMYAAYIARSRLEVCLSCWNVSSEKAGISGSLFAAAASV